MIASSCRRDTSAADTHDTHSTATSDVTVTSDLMMTTYAQLRVEDDELGTGGNEVIAFVRAHELHEYHLFVLV